MGVSSFWGGTRENSPNGLVGGVETSVTTSIESPGSMDGTSKAVRLVQRRKAPRGAAWRSIGVGCERVSPRLVMLTLIRTRPGAMLQKLMSVRSTTRSAEKRSDKKRSAEKGRAEVGRSRSDDVMTNPPMGSRWPREILPILEGQASKANGQRVIAAGSEPLETDRGKLLGRLALVQEFVTGPVFDLVIGAGPEPVAAAVADQDVGQAIVQDAQVVEHECAIGPAAVANVIDPILVAISRRPLIENRLQRRIILVMGCGTADQDVVACIAVELVVAIAPDEDVASEAGDELVVAIAADEDVVAQAADQRVVAGLAVEMVI